MAIEAYPGVNVIRCYNFCACLTFLWVLWIQDYLLC